MEMSPPITGGLTRRLRGMAWERRLFLQTSMLNTRNGQTLMLSKQPNTLGMARAGQMLMTNAIVICDGLLRLPGAMFHILALPKDVTIDI
jgi:hypothetical protein